MSPWPQAAAACFLVLAGCSQPTPVPPLPSIDASRFESAVRSVVEQAAKEAQAAPNDAAKVAQFAMTLQAHDQYAAAASAYRRALALDPANSTNAYYLGVSLTADGKYSEAIEPLRKSLAAGPSSIPVRLKLADALLSSGDAASAAKEYGAVIAQDSSVAAAHLGLGRTLTGDAATAEFARALALFPRFGAAQFALAAAYRRAGQEGEAAKLLVNYERDKTVTPPIADPALDKVYALGVSSTGLLRKAQILEREGHVPEALAIHEQVVQASPKLDQAWVNLISLYGRTGQPEKAAQAYERAVALAPNRADTYYNFGVLCAGAERWEEARRAFTKALELDPQNAEAAHNLGAMVERSGDLARATTLFQRAIAIQPNHRLAHFHLGRIYANQRQFSLAIAEFEKTIEPLDDQSPTYLYALGATHARAGRKQEAYTVLNRAKTEAARFNQPQLVASIERDLGALMR